VLDTLLRVGWIQSWPLHHKLSFVSSARTLSALDGQYVAAVLMFSFESFLELVPVHRIKSDSHFLSMLSLVVDSSDGV
jgi:hypothetical protein